MFNSTFANGEVKEFKENDKDNQEQELSSLAEIMLRKELVRKDIDADDEK